MIAQKILNHARTVVRDVLLSGIGGSYLIPTALRWHYLRLFGIAVEKCHIGGHCFMGGRNIVIHKDSFINYNCFFDASEKITIGQNVRIAMNSSFITSSHEIGEQGNRAGNIVTGPIVIGDGVWIGSNVTVLPGVSIGAGAVVASGAVVSRDIESNTLVGGIPAKTIRRL